MKPKSSILAALLVSAAVAIPASGQQDPGAYGPDPSAPTPTLHTSSNAADVDRQLAALEREERELKKQIAELSVEAKGAHTRTIVRGRAYVRLARAGLLPVGGGFQATVDHATKLERLRRAVTRDVELERRIAGRRVALSKKLDALRVRRGPLEVQHQAMAQARDALLAANDRALAFQRAFESSGPGGHTAIYGANVGPMDPSEVSTGFASMKGRLPFPLTGRAEIRSARRAGADGPGLEMRAPRGAAVRAVFPGRVAFADSYAAYGKTVIMDHGASHYTVCANLDDILVKVGEDVPSGTRIGSVGDLGAGPLLHFEIRVGSETVDPAEWFGI